MISWKKGNPSEQGFYIVAIEYDKSGLGTIASSYWDTNGGWEILSKGEKIVGFIPLDSLLKGANVPSPWEDD